MKRHKKPNFKLQKVYSDGHSEEAMYYSLADIEDNWGMGRRGFLATSFVALGAISGCAQVKINENFSVVKKQKESETTGKMASVGNEKKESMTSEKNAVVITGICPDDTTAHKSHVDIVDYSPNGKFLASASADSTIKLWEMPSGELIRTLKMESVNSLSFLPGEDIRASGVFSDGGIELWELPSGELLRGLKENQFDHVTAVSFSPDGKLLASGLYDHTINLWGIPSCNLLKKLFGHKNSVDSLCFSPDGNFLASGSKGDIRLWNIRQGILFGILRVSKKSNVAAISFSPDGRFLAAGLLGDIKLWEMPECTLSRTLRLPRMLDVTSLSFSPDGKFLASASMDSTILIWEIQTEKVVKILKGGKRYDNVKTVCFSPDGKFLVSGSENCTIKIWEMPSGKFLTCLFDPATLRKDKKMNQYTSINKYGYVVTYTLPCHSPIPPGAICTCNCIPGTWAWDHAPSAPRIKRKSGSYCSCNKICTCIPI